MSFLEDNKITKFLNEAYKELKKVVWPTKKQAIKLTLIVIVAVIISAICLGGFDLLFSEFVRLVVA